MPEALRSGAFAFASSRDRLQRIGRRVDALGMGYETRLRVLIDRLDQQPAAVTFDPFAAVPAAPAEIARESAGVAMAPRQRRSLATATAPHAGAVAVAVAAVVSGTKTPAVIAPPQTGMRLPDAAHMASPRLASPGVATVASANQALVGRAAVPHRAAPSVLAPWLPVPSSVAALEAPSPSLTRKGSTRPGQSPQFEALTALLAPGSEATAAAHPTLPAQQILQRQLRDLASARMPASAPASLRTLQRSHDAAAAPVAAAATARAASQLLGLPPALPAPLQSTPRDPSAPAATLLAAPAPRAASHLLPATSASGPTPVAGLAATTLLHAAGADPEAQPTEELLSAMNHLLIDQAWLRGVDLR
jgi:hypothetical protein